MTSIFKKLTLLAISLISFFCFSIIEIKGEEIVEVKVNIEDNGQEINIYVDLYKLKNLYSSSFTLSYDPKLLEIKDITVSSLISEGNIMVPFNEVAYEGNKVRYGFTFLGSEEVGINNELAFLKIKASKLKNEKILLDESMLKLQLVEKSQQGMKNIPYNITITHSNISNKEEGELGGLKNEEGKLEENNVVEHIETSLQEGQEEGEEEIKQEYENEDKDEDLIKDDKSLHYIIITLIVLFVVLALFFLRITYKIYKNGN